MPVEEGIQPSMLCIVSVYRPDLLTQARHMSGTMGAPMEVILDRRHGERRSVERPESTDRRQRRIDEELRTQGFVIIQ